MKLYLSNARYLDPDSFKLSSTQVEVTAGRDQGIRLLDRIPPYVPPEQIHDCQHKLVTKAFACGHHHVYSALARGMPAPKQTPRNFYEILKIIWWALDKQLDLDMIQASALVVAMDAAKNGVTFVIDHHASPFAVNGCLGVLADAFERVGVSHLLCYELSDRDGKVSAEQGLAETEAYLQHHQGLVGLHASFTVSDDLLNNAVALAQQHHSGIHVHVAEDPVDQHDCLEKYQQRVIQRFHAAGVLDFPKTILAHALYLDEHERSIVQNSAAWVVGNTESNMNNRVGPFNAAGLGERIMLGTDGMHSDMMRSCRVAYLAGQALESISMASAYQRLRNVHRYLKQNNFSGDGDNNLLIFDYQPPTPLHQDNFLGHFFFGLSRHHVDTVISDGRMIVKEGELTRIDEGEVLAYARTQATRLWDKLCA